MTVMACICFTGSKAAILFWPIKNSEDHLCSVQFMMLFLQQTGRKLA